MHINIGYIEQVIPVVVPFWEVDLDGQAVDLNNKSNTFIVLVLQHFHRLFIGG